MEIITEGIIIIEGIKGILQKIKSRIVIKEKAKGKIVRVFSVFIRRFLPLFLFPF